MTPLTIRGVQVFKEFLSPKAQSAMVDALREVIRAAPFYQPVTPGGRKMSVRMSAAGQYGWVTDRRGYRYERRHPEGMDWPPIPEPVMEVWRRVAPDAREPECCLINYYAEDARMGLHQDRDEADFSQPVVSISLGDSARFRIGNVEKGGSSESVWLESGDVLVMAGEARLIHHGVDRIRFGSSGLLKGGGRLNLTLRVVT